MPKRSLVAPFFSFDGENASSLGRVQGGESELDFWRRLDTRDGQRVRDLLNRCLARYTSPKKIRAMKRRLESSSDRQFSGAITELLMGEVLDAIATEVEIEPSIGVNRSRPDFRILDRDGNPVIVEVTRFLDCSDERHSHDIAWKSLWPQFMSIIEPMPYFVTVEAIGNPTPTTLNKSDRNRIHAAIQRSESLRQPQVVRFHADFSIEIESDGHLHELIGKKSMALVGYEFRGGLIDIPGKLRRVMMIVKEKAEKYADFPEPLVVVVSCPSYWFWLHQSYKMDSLEEMLEETPCAAIWLLQDLGLLTFGQCWNRLFENRRLHPAAGLGVLRHAQGRPFHEVARLGPEWNRPVIFDD